MSLADGISLLLAVVAAIGSVLLGVVVWFSERRNPMRVVFLWLAVFVALWIISNVAYTYSDPAFRYPLALASYGIAVFVAVTMLVFVMKLTRHHFTPIRRTIVLLGYSAGIIAAVPGIVGRGVEGISIITQPVGIVAYGLVVGGFLVASCFVLAVSFKSANRLQKRQIRYVLYGIAAASVIGLTFNLLLPIMGEYRFTQLGPAGATVFIAFIAYSTARYSLFDIRLAIVRVVAYVATLISLAIVYFGIAFFVSTVFNNSFLSPFQAVINVGAALIMALLFQPIKQFFDKITDRVFYRDNYNTDEFYAALNKVLSTVSDRRTLLERTSLLLRDTFRADQVFFFVNGENGRATVTGTKGHAKIVRKEAELFALPGGKNSPTKVILQALLPSDDPLRRMLVSHRIALVVPLFWNKEAIGYLCLGDRRSGDYTRRDMKTLLTIADELVIAIQNAQSLQQVKELNLHLEQRIDAATKELRSSNAQLQRLDEAKDEFISMASHQLRTPLTGIKGYLSMLIEGDVGKVTPEQKHLLTEAFMSSERMVRLIGDFLNVSRLQTGKFVIDKHPVDLALLVQHEIDGLALNAASRGMSFVYKKPKNIPLLELDEGKVQQVVMNFADNAMYYSKEGAAIVVSLKKTARGIEFTVKDKGIGVPAAEQKELFNKFFRATNARRARPDGTGVGLFLAKKVITSHGGTIIFESKEGKGSIFGFRLPLQ